jgi:polyferredoxin
VFEEINQIVINRKKLRDFSFIISIALTFVGLYFVWKGNNFLYLYYLSIAITILLLGLILPKVLTPLYYPWMVLAISLGFIMTRLILTILYYCVITPIGLLSRLLGKHFLELKWDHSQTSYWNKRRESLSKQSYERQF